MAVKNCFIRGSVVRYVQLPASGIDVQLLEDATRRGKPIISQKLECDLMDSWYIAFFRGSQSEQALIFLRRALSYTETSELQIK